jgi:hypothetical protein
VAPDGRRFSTHQTTFADHPFKNLSLEKRLGRVKNADFPTHDTGRRLILAILARMARESKLTRISLSKKSASLHRLEDVHQSSNRVLTA